MATISRQWIAQNINKFMELLEKSPVSAQCATKLSLHQTLKAKKRSANCYRIFQANVSIFFVRIVEKK